MELTQYTSSIFGLIRARLSLKDSDKSIVAHHLRYLYKQALYGYDQFAKKYASETAQREYERLGGEGRITQWHSRQQRKFDKPGRRDGQFQFEHVYTMGMFDRALGRLSEDGALTEDDVNRIVTENFAVAWIMKHEDGKLPKSHRGESLADALAVYKRYGIHLIPACEQVT